MFDLNKQECLMDFAYDRQLVHSQLINYKDIFTIDSDELPTIEEYETFCAERDNYRYDE